MKIAAVEAHKLYPKAIKEAWSEDEYVWPSEPPSFFVKVTDESGAYGIGEATSQQWYLGETADQIADVERWIAGGAPWPSEDRIAAIVRDTAGMTEVSIILHEYTHFLTRNHGSHLYPKWFDVLKPRD